MKWSFGRPQQNMFDPCIPFFLQNSLPMVWMILHQVLIDISQTTQAGKMFLKTENWKKGNYSNDRKIGKKSLEGKNLGIAIDDKLLLTKHK